MKYLYGLVLVSFAVWSVLQLTSVLHSTCPSHTQPSQSLVQSSQRLLLALPFARFQWPLLRESLRLWSDASFFPCPNRWASSPVDLLLFASADPKNLLRAEASRLVESALWRRCFDRVMFRDAKLSARDDRYGVGTLRMFFDLVEHSDPRHSYFFLMEPDTWPVRRDWLPAMMAQIEGQRFWQKVNQFSSLT
jgi:hypothetical protein